MNEPSGRGLIAADGSSDLGFFDRDGKPIGPATQLPSHSRASASAPPSCPSPPPHRA